MMHAIRIISGVCLALFVLNNSLWAKCPVTDGTTLIVHAAVGDLIVDTTGREPYVEAQVNNSKIHIQETCGKNIEVTNNETDQAHGPIVWKITAPKTLNLDLVTMAGNINVGDVDGNVILRTAGGSITAGHVKGKAAIITQGGSIKAGNIGGDAELRSQGRTLEFGDIGGNAEFHTTAGVVRGGNIAGSANIEAGRSISIVRVG